MSISARKAKIRSNRELWEEAISDAERRIQKLRNSIRVFAARRDAGEPWPGKRHSADIIRQGG
jgi:hypothetical protein